MSAHRPETGQHLAAGSRNLAFARALMADGIERVTPPAYDWVLVVAFYAAVRFVNAYHWEQFGSDPMDHVARNGFVNRVQELRPIATAYDALYGRSRVVRYRISGAVNESAATAAIAIAARVEETVRTLL